MITIAASLLNGFSTNRFAIAIFVAAVVVAVVFAPGLVEAAAEAVEAAALSGG